MKNVSAMFSDCPVYQDKDSFNYHQLSEECKTEGIQLNKFLPRSAGELKKKVLPERDNYLGYLIQSQSIVNLNAPSGVCKTWLAMALCTAIATGGECINWKATSPRRIVYLDAEMPEADIQGRVVSFSKGLSGQALNLFDRNFRILNLDGAGEPLPDLTSELGQKIVEYHCKDADVLVIDNLISVLTDTDDQDVLRVKQFTSWLRKMRGSGKTIITINHTTKDLKRLGSVVLDTYNDVTVDIREPVLKKGEDKKDYLHLIFAKGRHLTPEQKKTIHFKFSIDERGVKFWQIRPES
ncbi:AAA family ATPase [Alteromonas ponticola]|uniref:AAA family ATPase n=1 Tax=Alteromonas ponticola TaxID=2720613 RepID=A0ABX1R5S7_9ALTE|nr:AAA family ATPase [Alteromonas ponticola]NMH61271.1 AAA family ATPase [Alteromonas ponticola]